ncbi:hypothetical protein [Halapricum desulfuricans]|uniref:hypothetical protein n=1 Tax=Halapricum desulfuricans TaxID=2841257 RepID=UPI001E44282C|nr:hypothetical protein [Halapricum desulfuricans]
MVVSQHINKEFTHRMTNRLHIFKYLFDEISTDLARLEGPDEDIDEEEKIEHICKEILSFEALNDIAPMGLDEKIREDIDALHEVLKSKGIDEFLSELEYIESRAESKRERLEREIIDDYINISNSHRMSEIYIADTVESDVQAKDLVKGGYWCRNHSNRFILAHEDDLAFKKRDEISEILRKNINSDVDIHSPKLIVERHEISQ